MKQANPFLFIIYACFSFLSLTAQQNKSSKSSNGAKAGDVAPNAKYLDVDALEPFNRGAAIVRKGEATALIDTSGNFIIPFNKYNFLTTIEQNAFGSGFFLTLEGNVLNYKGQLIVKASEFKTSAFTITDDGKYCYGVYPSNKTVYIDLEGHQYTTSFAAYKVHNDIGIVGRKEGFNGGDQYFLNLKNQRITNKTYFNIEPFSEGMAIVSIRDEFGNIKYGFIDTKGVEAIPLKFSNAPTSFRYGISIVTPADKAEFLKAFINKKGEIIYKETMAANQKYGSLSYFKNGLIYSQERNFLMDTTGKFFTTDDLLKSFGTNSQVYKIKELTDFNSSIDDGKFRIEMGDHYLYDAQKNVFSPNKMGFIDLISKKIVEAAFCNYVAGRFDLVFDKVSKLAYAERCLGDWKIR